MIAETHLTGVVCGARWKEWEWSHAHAYSLKTRLGFLAYQGEISCRALIPDTNHNRDWQFTRRVHQLAYWLDQECNRR